jgi:molybdopterin/thiamine biosynthesis adenylyltransferase
MSRYIGVLGVDAVSKQSEANVLLLGLGGLGVEIAKNITLSGVKRVTLWDDRIVEESDQCG